MSKAGIYEEISNYIDGAMSGSELKEFECSKIHDLVLL